MNLFQFSKFLLNRIRFPAQAAVADDLVNAGKDAFLKATPETVGTFRNWNPVTETLDAFFRRTDLPQIGSRIRRVVDEFHSPDFVLPRTDAGQAIIDVSRDAELKGNFWKETILGPFEKLVHKAKVTGEGSTRLQRALENPKLWEQLHPEERSLYDFLKGQYDFTWKSLIAKTVGNDPARIRRVWRYAAKDLSVEEWAMMDAGMQQAVRWAKATIKNYAPHLWKKEDLIPILEKTRMENVLKYRRVMDPKKKEAYRKTVAEYDEALQRLAGPDPLQFEGLPKEILFRHGLMRKGALGYQEDAIRGFRSYVHSMARKMFDEPALKVMAEQYNLLPKEYRPYTHRFIRDWAGLSSRNPLDHVAGNVAGFEYMRALGLNPRSALTNLTQQINTWVEAGHPKWSIKGYQRALSSEGEELWKKTGLRTQIPQVLTEELHPEAGKIEKLKRISGYFFNKAEEANRKHAFLTFLTKAETPKFDGGLGLDSAAAWKYAIDNVYKTQFQYGRGGMPMVLRTPAGRIIGQFSSFSIKQAELLWRWLKENPGKLLYYGGVAEGGNLTLQHLLGIDLSNALGFGISWGEAMDAFLSMSKGEFDEMFTHGELAFAQGTGILPSLPGPGAAAVFNVLKAIEKGEPVSEALAKELTPVAWQRVEDILTNIKNRSLAIEPGKIPVGKTEGLPFAKEVKDIMFEQGLGKTLLEIGPKGYERTKKVKEWFKASKMDLLESKRKRTIAEAIAMGNEKKAQKLIEDWGVVPTRDAIYEAILRRNLPRELRPRYQKQSLRQMLRELKKYEE